MRGQKGITLVALVITIIILLILAGIAVASLTDENNGLFRRAKEAKDSTINAQKNENLAMNSYTDSINNVLRGIE